MVISWPRRNEDSPRLVIDYSICCTCTFCGGWRSGCVTALSVVWKCLVIGWDVDRVKYIFSIKWGKKIQ